MFRAFILWPSASCRTESTVGALILSRSTICYIHMRSLGCWLAKRIFTQGRLLKRLVFWRRESPGKKSWVLSFHLVMLEPIALITMSWCWGIHPVDLELAAHPARATKTSSTWTIWSTTSSKNKKEAIWWRWENPRSLASFIRLWTHMIWNQAQKAS